jgi:hypothetical protein
VVRLREILILILNIATNIRLPVIDEMKLRSALLALLLATPAATLAADAPEHGKAATADASPVDAGGVEAELGYAPVWNVRSAARGFEAAERGSTHGFAATVTAGVLPDVDVKLSGGFASTHDAASAGPTRGSGLTDATVGARWRFLNLEGPALELAATADLVMPVGSRGTGSALGLTQDFWSARGALVASKDFGALTANGELALATPVSGDAAGLRSVAQANAAVGYQLTDWLQPELELNYTHQAAVGADAQVLAVTAGVVAPFGAGHRIVAAVQQGVWGSNTTQTTSAVLSFKTALR